jgi:hypothetical protein
MFHDFKRKPPYPLGRFFLPDPSGHGGYQVSGHRNANRAGAHQAAELSHLLYRLDVVHVRGDFQSRPVAASGY